MPAGEVVAPDGQRQLQRAVRTAEHVSGLTFSVYVGTSGADPRAFAEQRHADLPAAEDAVLVMCDPERRALEIVTGSRARRLLDDVDCRLAAASMQVSFAADDLLGGLVTGVQQLGQSARHPRTLHTARIS